MPKITVIVGIPVKFDYVVLKRAALNLQVFPLAHRCWYLLCSATLFYGSARHRKKFKEIAIAWIAANQLGRRNLTPSQKAVLALEIEKQLADVAKLRRRATQNNNAGRAVGATLPQQEQDRARDKAAELVGASPRYVQDAKQIAKDAPEVLDQVKQGQLSIPQAKQDRPTRRGKGAVQNNTSTNKVAPNEDGSRLDRTPST